jgi:hypothetical protein
VHNSQVSSKLQQYPSPTLRRQNVLHVPVEPIGTSTWDQSMRLTAVFYFVTRQLHSRQLIFTPTAKYFTQNDFYFICSHLYIVYLG